MADTFPRTSRPADPFRRPTLQDVAERAGVSRALVSIVVRGAPGASASTRARVLAVADELGYRPDAHARLLARQRARLLGVTVQLGHPFHADVVAGLYPAVERYGYELVLSATAPGRDERRAVETLLDYRSEGLILVAPDAAETTLAVLARRLPTAVLARRVQAEQVSVVRTADDVGVGQAVDHLVGLGHRSIAHVDGGALPAAEDRRDGYRSAVRRHGLDPWPVAGGQSEEDGARAARELLAQGLPTAVVCFNDRCAVGLLDVLIRTGVRVPDDISVVGFDDSQLARLSHINLTTVGQDVERMAELAVAELVDRIDGCLPENPAAPTGPAHRPAGGPVRETVLPPRLVVRGSTSRPAGR
ncbi:MAG TPA: LacI family DNA-binding transcriptional regulator [Kineosporiaceae bacterium]